MKNRIFENRILSITFFPKKKEVEDWSEELFHWLFCIHPEYADDWIYSKKENELKDSLLDIIEKAYHSKAEAENCVSLFFKKLPDLFQLLKEDLETVVNFDPAAKSREEVLFTYPGFYAITIHRLVHELWKIKIPIIPRLMSEISHSKTGIDIHPGAVIGERFFIDHGTGIVVGETSVIGNDVKIYQGVTLGALSVSKDKAETKRHPTIGNRVIIYANATILGGNTHIGDDSTIGGNVWITNSIPANSLVYHKSEIIIKSNSDFPEPLDFII
jgi:serine O-acetyltransferase